MMGIVSLWEIVKGMFGVLHRPNGPAGGAEITEQHHIPSSSMEIRLTELLATPFIRAVREDDKVTNRPGRTAR